jgi:1-acyl-sn-glycerol-3-phosphate acyltransferase
MLRYGKFPMGIGNHIKFSVHEPIEMGIFTDKKTLLSSVEHTITTAICVN